VSTDRAAAPCYLTLVCQGATRATHLAAFPADEPLEHDQASRLESRAALSVRRTTVVYASPAASARETAAALNLDAQFVPELGECDFGRWRGLRLQEVNAKEPAALETWFKDLSAAPHGGESLRSVGDRAHRWLKSLLGHSGHVIAVTNSIVIRQLILNVLEAPASSFWRIDILPLSCVELASNGTRWALRAT
jgi:broad specificity phosphatase PhoE